MNILILHKNPYYGRGLSDALNDISDGISCRYIQYACEENIAKYDILITDTYFLQMVCRSAENIFFERMKIILLREKNTPVDTVSDIYDISIPDDAPIEVFMREIVSVATSTKDKTLRRRTRHDRLSSREYQVAIALLNNENKNIKVAMLLGLDEKTISTYKTRIFRKLKIKSVLELQDALKKLNII